MPKSQTDVIDRGDMAKLCQVLDSILPELKGGDRVGFALIVFDFGGGGNIQWASNGERTDMIAALRELLGKWAADGSVQN